MKRLLPLVFFNMLSCAAYETTNSRPRTAQEIEKEEFAMLMKKDSLEKKETVTESLNVLLNEDPNNKKVSLIVNNNTNCDIILRFSGEKFYNLPIYKNKKNFILLEKGTYSLGANLCNARYSSSKTFNESITLTLSEKQ